MIGKLNYLLGSSVHFIAISLLVFCALATPAGAQSVYTTPYTFSSIAGSGGYGTNDGTNRNAEFSYFYGVAVDSNGNLFVADTDNSTIRKISLIGSNWVVTTLAGTAGVTGTNDGTNGAAQFNNPYGVAVDGAGNIYVADTYNYTIRKVSAMGTNWVTTTLAGKAGIYGTLDGTNGAALFYQPTGLALDSAGNVYVTDPANSTVREVSSVGTKWVVTTLATYPTFDQPAGIAVDAAGHVFVTDVGFQTISVLSPVGTNWGVTRLAGRGGYETGSADGTGTNAQFAFPFWLAVDGADNLYVADSFNDTIRKVSPRGPNWVVTTLAGTVNREGNVDGTGGNAWFSFPGGVAVDADGHVFVADTDDATLREGTNSLPSYSIPIFPGLNLIANQLDNGSNTLDEIIPVAPDGSVVYKYNNADGTWAAATYSAAQGAWSPAGLSLNPGEGAFFQSPTNFSLAYFQSPTNFTIGYFQSPTNFDVSDFQSPTNFGIASFQSPTNFGVAYFQSPTNWSLTFTGSPNISTPLSPGPVGLVSLVSDTINAIADYEDIFGAYPPEETTVYQWDAQAQEYLSNEFILGNWTPGPGEPVFAVGEPAWISTSGASPPAIAVAPVIAVQPSDLTVQPGGTATFTVTADGSAPLAYQWFANGVPIAGAIGSSFTIANVRASDQATYSVSAQNSFGSALSTGSVLSTSEFTVVPVPTGSDCCWTFDLSQISGPATDITSITGTVETPGVTILIAAGPAGPATFVPSYATWSIPGGNGLFNNPIVTACFNSIPTTGATISFQVEPSGQTVVVSIGTNGGCGQVAVVTTVAFGPQCCANKSWNFEGPFPGKDYTFDDSDFVFCATTSANSTLWPSARYGQAMTYHNQNTQDIQPGLLMFGGADGSGVPNNETWLWTGAWKATGCPDPDYPTIPARSFHAMACDLGRQRTALFGGLDSSGAKLNDTWEWNSVPQEWTQITPANSPPAARQGHAMAYFPDAERIVLFGGLGVSGFLNDTWLWDGTYWTQLTLPGPSARQGHAMVYDPNLDGVILVGGTDANGVEGDMWILTYQAGVYQWSQMGSTVPPRTGHGMAYDPNCTEIVLFGGFDTNGNPRGDTWQYSDVTHDWVELSSVGTGLPPPARGATSAAYYPSNMSFDLFGGNLNESSTTNFAQTVDPLPANDVNAFFYNPNPVFYGQCVNYTPCSNVVAGQLWQRSLSTAQFSWHHTGNYKWRADHSINYWVSIDSDPGNTTQTGVCPPTWGTYSQYRAKRRPKCYDNVYPPVYGCPADPLPNSYKCHWQRMSFPIYSDYAIDGNFCPGIDINMIWRNSDFGSTGFGQLLFGGGDEDLSTVGALGGQVGNGPTPESPFPGTCSPGQAYNVYWQYSDPSTYSPNGSGFPTENEYNTYALFNTIGDNAKVDLGWFIQDVGVGTGIGESNPCLTESGGDPCRLAYFEYDQVSGTELRFKIRVAGPDLTNVSILLNEGGQRQFLFYIDADNSTNTGDQCCSDMGADFYVQMLQTLSPDLSKVVTTGSVFYWNPCATNTNGCAASGVWTPELGNPVYDIFAGQTEILATVPMSTVGDPQGCYASWAVSEAAGSVCGENSLPNRPCECQLRLQRVPDTNCPYVIYADTGQVSSGNLSAPIVVTFNKAMSVITPADITITPSQGFNAFIVDPADNVLNIRPASGTWLPGCYTVTLSTTIKDASGNSLCTNSIFNLCVPDLSFYVTDQHGNATNYFNQGDTIYIHGCGFQPYTSITLYLVQAENVDNSGSLLTDWTTGGPVTVTTDMNGCLDGPPAVGIPTQPGVYKVVADVNNDGIYETNVDHVSDLCGLGLTYGMPCTNLVEDDLAAWWPFCESSAAGPVNEMVNANPGLVVGPYTTLIPGIVGQARTFNETYPAPGTPTYVYVPNALDFNSLLNIGSDDISIDLWVNTTETAEAPIVDKRQFSGFNGGAFSGYYFYLLNGVPMFQMSDGTTTWTFTSSAALSAATGNWVHVAVTVDQVLFGVTNYVNGVPYTAYPSTAYTAAVDTDNPHNNNADLWMAASHAAPSPAPFFIGAMDELTIYEVPLTAEQVGYIYSNRASGTCDEPAVSTNSSVIGVTNYLGDWAQFSIAASSSLTLGYQWYLNGIPLTNNPFVIGAQSNILLIQATNILQSGAIWVSITNAAGALVSSSVPFEIRPVASSTPMFEVDSQWKYLADGSDPGTNWNQDGFNDGAWDSGSGLFGFAPTNVWPYPFETTLEPPALGGPITVYYRAVFQWDGVTNDVNLVSTNFIQDGAVFYLNGAEVGRLRVPQDQNPDTLATPQPNPGHPETITFPVGSLRLGTNLLAVEVHQSSADAEQDVFGLALTANVSLGFLPSLTINQTGTIFTVRWSGPGTLQSTPNITTPWSNVPASSVLTVPTTNATEFYRLRVP